MSTVIPGPRPVVWSAPSSNLIRSWDDDLSVVYGGACGDTHLLTPLAGEILRLLAQGSGTSDMLLRDMADIFENHDRDRALAIIEKVLSELQSIDLVFNDTN